MKSPELTEFFSLLGKAKKEKKEEFDNLLKDADINLDVLTSTVVSGIKEAKVNIKKQKKKEEKLIEQLDTLIDTIEKPKEIKDITEPAVTVGVPEDFDVSKLEEDPITVQDWNNGDDIKFTEVDTVDIIKPEPIKTPKISDTVAQAIKFIEETNIKEEIENSDETSIENLKGEIKQVRDILYKVLSHGPGSGEVNLLKLDDVDEDSAKVDGKFLKYESSSGKFVGADASGGGSENIAYTGIVTAAQFSGYSHLIAPYGSTTTITVAVATKTTAHRYYGTGSSNGYVLDNVESPFLTLTPGRTYRFSGSVAGSHPFRFYYDAGKTTQYTTGVTVGSGYVDLEVTDTTPTVLHYQCSSHGYMGNAIQVNSNVVDTPSGGTVRGTLTATAFSGTLTGNVTGNVTGDVTGDLTGDITSSGDSQFTNRLQLKSTDGTPARLDFYCESSNAHYLRLQAPPHAQFSGNPTVVLPNSAGTLLLSDGSGASLSNLNASNISSGTINAARIPTLNQDTTGNAGSATILENARTIGGVSFNGSANINLPGVNAAGNQNTTGNAATSTLATNAQGLTGTPSITINGLNAATGTFSGNVTIGGVLTYEDVTNVDSIGIITARSGVLVGSGVTLSKDGDVFATGITTSTKVHVGVDTGVYDEDLVVTGNARVTGILTIGTGSIVLDPTAKQLRGLEEIVIGIANTITIKQDDKGEIEFTDAVGTPKSVGIGTTVSVNTSGIITASSFVGGFTGDLTGTASNSTQLGGQAASHYLNYNNFSNTPTIPTNTNQLTNGAAFVTSSIINALSASNLSSGTIPDARFPSTLPAIDGSALTGIAVTSNVRTGILDVAGIATFRNDTLIGTGVTLSPDGDVFTTGVTTSTSFVGDLTGDVTGDVTGTASNATLAVSAQGLTGSPTITITNVNAVDAIISGNLSVAGTITSLDQNDISVTGIMTASAGVDLGDPGIVTLSSDTLTTTSTNADTISSISATVFRSATFQVQVTRGTQYHMTTINVIHNGTVAFMSEYGTIRTGAVLATFDADINSGNLRLRATPTSADSTVFKLSKTTVKV